MENYSLDDAELAAIEARWACAGSPNCCEGEINMSHGPRCPRFNDPMNDVVRLVAEVKRLRFARVVGFMHGLVAGRDEG